MGSHPWTPCVNFVRGIHSHNKKYHSGIRGIYITNTSTTMVFAKEKNRFTTITVSRTITFTITIVKSSGLVVVERLERSLQFLFSRVERRSSSCFTCFSAILIISCRNWHLT